MAVGMYTARHAVHMQVNIKYPKLSQKVSLFCTKCKPCHKHPIIVASCALKQEEQKQILGQDQNAATKMQNNQTRKKGSRMRRFQIARVSKPCINIRNSVLRILAARKWVDSSWKDKVESLALPRDPSMTTNRPVILLGVCRPSPRAVHMGCRWWVHDDRHSGRDRHRPGTTQHCRMAGGIRRWWCLPRCSRGIAVAAWKGNSRRTIRCDIVVIIGILFILGIGAMRLR